MAAIDQGTKKGEEGGVGPSLKGKYPYPATKQTKYPIGGTNSGGRGKKPPLQTRFKKGSP